MFIVISDNCESYSDHSHMTVLVCETRDEAKEAVILLREWMREASVRISDDWNKFQNRPGKDEETTGHNGNGYCLYWDQYANEIDSLPIQVTTECFPYSIFSPLGESDLKRAIDYMEVPLWAKDTK